MQTRASLFALLTAISLPLAAQDASPPTSAAASDPLRQMPVFNFREGGKSHLLLHGTAVAPKAQGDATVRYKDGNSQISADAKALPPPSSLGPYTTYVLWVVGPDGTAANQGVLAGADGGKGGLETMYGASQFGLLVTAEPHFAVTVPSNMIVLYNTPDRVNGTQGTLRQLAASADYSRLGPVAAGKGVPTELVQARYALAIARAAGAEKYASAAYENAENKLTAAEEAQAGNRKDRKTAVDDAREVVVAGEAARRAASAAAATAATAAAAEATASAAARQAKGEEQSEELRRRLNAVLPTRATEQGLIAEIGGVHFATGKAEVDGTAREDLSRFSGIVASYEALKFKINGYTDALGAIKTNQALSLRRAISVRDYLISQNVPASRIDVAGLGPSNPIADNATAEGRAQNRRVEIVISGEPLTGASPERR